MDDWSARYGGDVLKAKTPKKHLPQVPADIGLVVEDVSSGWVGAVTRTEQIGAVWVVVLQDRKGRSKSFELGPGFWIDGAAVELVRPRPQSPTVRGRPRSASGSTAVVNAPARVARQSRIWVEGTHDAELVEKIWGHDLRVDGIVVEPLGGIDDLPDRVAQFGPRSDARLGILVDHLVAGSKETRIAQQTLQKTPGSEFVCILGHPFVDVWQAVRPVRLGLEAWPTISRDIEWKDGILTHLGWPAGTVADRAAGWQQILGTVTHFSHLEAAFLGRVEELIDFVTMPQE